MKLVKILKQLNNKVLDMEVTCSIYLTNGFCIVCKEKKDVLYILECLVNNCFIEIHCKDYLNCLDMEELFNFAINQNEYNTLENGVNKKNIVYNYTDESEDMPF